MCRFLLPLLALLLLASTVQAQSEAETFFETRIRPVLAGTCFKCHGGNKVSAGLRVDSRQALLGGGQSGPALVPGAPERSLLIRALRHSATAEIKMPPNQKLSDSTIADFERWVKEGAIWPAAAPGVDVFAAGKHWAFVPVRKPQPPHDSSGWAGGPLDCFIAAGQRERGVRPVAPADRRTWLRRVTFDLIGLPPTPEEIAAFLADSSAEAHARVVDRLLASPRYGERWGRHWMDLVRYADTAGDNADYPIPEAVLYRDYVIDSFNADKPYDAFLREQLAGDLLARQGPSETYAERTIATTYLALSRRYLTAPYEQWHLTLEDTIDATGRAFLGLTLRCARCHDHKFDPIRQEDYYALYGIFASTQLPYAGSEEFSSKKFPRDHFVPLLPPAEALPKLEAHRKKLAELRNEIDQIAKDPRVRLTGEQGLANKRMQEKLAELRRELFDLERTNLPADLPGAYAVSDGKPADVPLQRSGDPGQPGPVVKRGVPKFLAGSRPFVIAPGSSGRLELARWLTAPENPLTARVMVNRIWQHHFGKGLVPTPSNFGLSGQPPTHPELLDWLANRFIESGWSIKAMHRLIVLSQTYRLASVLDSANIARDPANSGYWHFERRRLDAEAIRDAMLAVSGTLDLRRPGPHPFPPMSTWAWTQHAPFKEVYPSRHRTVYLMTQRLQRHPFLALFDGPDTNVTTDTRTRSTVPLQALYLMNNPFVTEQAKALAARLLRGSPELGQRVQLGFELAWGRPSVEAEIEAARHYLERYEHELTRLDVPIPARELEAWTSLSRVLLGANEFMYVD
ncbi:MAG TPA: PSD1 and planctomycete cytochrome C domain-containing protein [Gemmataceae bacterium]|nr:PSD1 and planctomycete cytochrome C domain-containing protein [Gemmataceae bacterium]